MRFFAHAAALALLSTAALADPAAAPSGALAEKILGHQLKPDDNYACFARIYDARHLGRHPHQNVVEALLFMTADGSQSEGALFEFAFRFRGDRKLHFGESICALGESESGQPHVSCNAPCDGGGIGDISVDGPAKARLRLSRGVADAAAGSPDVPPLALKSDDRVFDLTRAPLARCSRFHHSQALGSGI
jgi:hypothetical protein